MILASLEPNYCGLQPVSDSFTIDLDLSKFYVRELGSISDAEDSADSLWGRAIDRTHRGKVTKSRKSSKKTQKRIDKEEGLEKTTLKVFLNLQAQTWAMARRNTAAFAEPVNSISLSLLEAIEKSTKTGTKSDGEIWDKRIEEEAHVRGIWLPKLDEAAEKAVVSRQLLFKMRGLSKEVNRAIKKVMSIPDSPEEEELRHKLRILMIDESALAIEESEWEARHSNWAYSDLDEIFNEAREIVYESCQRINMVGRIEKALWKSATIQLRRLDQYRREKNLVQLTNSRDLRIGEPCLFGAPLLSLDPSILLSSSSDRTHSLLSSSSSDLTHSSSSYQRVTKRRMDGRRR